MNASVIVYLFLILCSYESTIWQKCTDENRHWVELNHRFSCLIEQIYCFNVSNKIYLEAIDCTIPMVTNGKNSYESLEQLIYPRSLNLPQCDCIERIMGTYHSDIPLRSITTQERIALRLNFPEIVFWWNSSSGLRPPTQLCTHSCYYIC